MGRIMFGSVVPASTGEVGSRRRMWSTGGAKRGRDSVSSPTRSRRDAQQNPVRLASFRGGAPDSRTVFLGSFR